jgi:hypothetical protein
VFAGGRDAAPVDHGAVPAAQPALRAEGVLPDPVQPGVQLVHHRGISVVDQVCYRVMLHTR